VLLKALDPAWVRPWQGNNIIRLVDCGGRNALIERMPQELKSCLQAGGHTTLMVWADLDHDTATGDQLRTRFWDEAQTTGVTRQQFDEVVFVFAKDRIENWIEFLLTGTTDELQEGPRQKHDRPVADAARTLARRCRGGETAPPNPPSLEWSCGNWRALVRRMHG
jgi:hypothetical protein